MKLYIKEHLRLNGITQQMLADRMSVSLPTIKTTLSKDNITLTTLERIAKAIGIVPIKLLLPPGEVKDKQESGCTCPSCGKRLRIIADD